MINVVSWITGAALSVIGRTANFALLLRACIDTAAANGVVAVNTDITEVDIGIIAILASVVRTSVALSTRAGSHTVRIETGETDTASSASGAGVETNTADASTVCGNEVTQTRAANIGCRAF